MRYSLELGIDLPRERVVELFLDAENLREWQPGFVSVQPIGEQPMMGILLYVPALEAVPDVAVQGAQVWAVHVYASRSQGELLSAHRSAGGEFHSKWRAFFAGLAVGVVAVGLLFAFFFVAPEHWLPPE